MLLVDWNLCWGYPATTRITWFTHDKLKTKTNEAAACKVGNFEGKLLYGLNCSNCRFARMENETWKERSSLVQDCGCCHPRLSDESWFVQRKTVSLAVFVVPGKYSVSCWWQLCSVSLPHQLHCCWYLHQFILTILNYLNTAFLWGVLFNMFD